MLASGFRTQSLCRSLARRLQGPLYASRRSVATDKATTPWFVDPEYESPLARQPPPHLKPSSSLTPSEPTSTTITTTRVSAPPIPEDAPEPIKLVHAALSRSPHLDISTLTASRAVQPPPGPPLPAKKPQGRRKRGATHAGESMFDVPGGIWNWVVMAQVKVGTENRGAVESVVRVVRKTPPLPLAAKSKRRMGNGWAMVDAGDFAVHILSKEAREKYFSSSTW